MCSVANVRVLLMGGSFGWTRVMWMSIVGGFCTAVAAVVAFDLATFCSGFLFVGAWGTECGCVFMCVSAGMGVCWCV